MGVLDTELSIKTADPENMLQSIDDFADQLHSAHDLFAQFVLPTHFIQAREVIILGSAAGAIAAEMVVALCRETSSVPVAVHEGGQLPAHVGSHSLVIGVSYSGHETETLTAFADAARRGAKLVGISAGGELGALCRKYRAPHYQIHYGAQPRAAFGYLFMPLLGIVHRLGLLEFESSDAIAVAIDGVRAYQCRLTATVATQQNPAKQLAETLSVALPVFVSSELLAPVARRWKTQWHENAKRLAFTDIVPVVTRSTVEGLPYAAKQADALMVVTLRSQADDDASALSQNILQQFAQKIRFPFTEVVAQPSLSPLQDILMLTLLGDYTSTYLAILSGVDPTPTPHIMELSEQAIRSSRVV